MSVTFLKQRGTIERALYTVLDSHIDLHRSTNAETPQQRSSGSGRSIFNSCGTRKLRVSGPPDELDSLREEIAATVKRRPGYLETDLRLSVTMTEAGSASTVLVGLDGGTKLREKRVVGLAEVCGAIEAMPMRRAELRRK